jgi:hypothetical protein
VVETSKTLVTLPKKNSVEHAVELKRFLFLLALSLYSLPLSHGKSQAINEERLKKMLLDAGVPDVELPERFASQLADKMRERIQIALIALKHNFMAASHYLGEDKGYYLNTGYRIKYRE